MRFFIKKEYSDKKGFTLFIAVIMASALLLISFAISDIVFKQLQLTFSEKDSQLAFYAADSGAECALYWDIKQGSDVFATTSAATNVTCNNNPAIVLTRQFTATNGTTTYTVNYGVGAQTDPCAYITVSKLYGVVVQPSTLGLITKIESRGYNTCDSSNIRRVERALRVTY